jgi:geranylgeranyl diphosphate synthase, type I
VFGDPGQTGKPVADDLREGKPTPLLAIARARAEGPDAALLERSGAPDLSVDELISMRDVLERTGARAEVERTIDDLREQAITRLDDVDLTPPARRALTMLAGYVARRDR